MSNNTISGDVLDEQDKKNQNFSPPPKPKKPDLKPEFVEIAKNYAQATGKSNISPSQIKRLQESTTSENAKATLDFIKKHPELLKTTFSLLRLKVTVDELKYILDIQKPKNTVKTPHRERPKMGEFGIPDDVDLSWIPDLPF